MKRDDMDMDKTEAIPRRRAMGRLAAIVGTGVGVALFSGQRRAHARELENAAARREDQPGERGHDPHDGPIWIGHI